MHWWKAVPTLRMGLWLIIFSLIAVPWALGQSLLQTVQLKAGEGADLLELTFDRELETSPILNFEKGYFSLRLTGVKLGEGLTFPKPAGLIKQFRSNQGKDSVLIEIILQNPAITSDQTIQYKIQGIVLSLTLDHKLAQAVATPVPEKTISSEERQRLTKDEGFVPTFGEEGSVPNNAAGSPGVLGSGGASQEWASTMLLMILALLLILLFLYGLLYLYNKFLSGRLPMLKGKWAIRTVSTFYIGPKQKIVVLEIEKQYFACGITPSNITFLTELRHPQDQSFLSHVLVGQESIQFNAAAARQELNQALETKRKTAAVGAKPSVPPKPAPAAQPSPVANASEAAHDALFNQEPSAPIKTFKTPTPAVPKNEPEVPMTEEASMQQFAQMLTKKLKSLKPLN